VRAGLRLFRWVAGIRGAVLAKIGGLHGEASRCLNGMRMMVSPEKEGGQAGGEGGRGRPRVTG
jgi:hypothetical protein